MEEAPPYHDQVSEEIYPEEELVENPWHHGLTNKQRAFVEEYAKDWNATKAAERAGYSPKTANEQGCQNLAKLSIQKALKSYLDANAMSTEEAINKLTAWGRGSLEPFLRSGQIDLDTPSARENIHLIKELEQTKTTRMGEDFTSETVKTRIKINDPMAAIVKILEVKGKLVKKIEHSGPGGGPIPIDDVTDLTDEQLRERIAALRTGIIPADSGAQESK